MKTKFDLNAVASRIILSVLFLNVGLFSNALAQSTGIQVTSAPQTTNQNVQAHNSIQLSDDMWVGSLMSTDLVGNLSGQSVSILKICLKLDDDQIEEIENLKKLTWETEQCGKYLSKLEIDKYGKLLDPGDVEKEGAGLIKSTYDDWNRINKEDLAQAVKVRRLLGAKDEKFREWVFEQEQLTNSVRSLKENENPDIDKIATETLTASQKNFKNNTQGNLGEHKKMLLLRTQYLLIEHGVEVTPGPRKLMGHRKYIQDQKAKLLNDIGRIATDQ